MTGSLQLIFELLAATAVDPSVAVDTDALTPAKYADLIVVSDQILSIGPAVVNQAVALPACCLVLIVSDKLITLRLASGETPLAIRYFVTAGADNGDTAYPAQSLLLSGNTVDTASVRVIGLGKVS